MTNRQWRWIVTDLDTQTTTLLDRLASDRKATYVLNDAAVAEMSVPSDSSEVNNPHTDGDSLVAMNSRLLYGLRRENPDPDRPWVCRFGGTINIVEDEADSDSPKSHLTAYDPWELLKHRPILNATGHIPVNGLTFEDTPLNEVVVALLQRTHLEHGTCRIDFGQTDGYEGTIEVLDEITKHFDPGTSVGEAWQELCELGCDIVLTPVYDVNRPGIVAELNIYAEAGAGRPEAVFGWNRFPRSLVGISRLLDGTQMANKLLAYSQDGEPSAIKTNAASVSKFGEYWLEKFYSSDYPQAVVEALALAELRIRKNGHLALTLDPAPEFSPDPFLEYYLGDSVPVFASNHLRSPLTIQPSEDFRLRIQGLPILMSDDGVESVDKLLLSFPLEAGE